MQILDAVNEAIDSRIKSLNGGLLPWKIWVLVKKMG